MRGNDTYADKCVDRLSSTRSPILGRVGSLQYGAIVDVPLTKVITKWLKQSGIVLLLPHEYMLLPRARLYLSNVRDYSLDGAGPEHSLSRIERMLQVRPPFDSSVSH